MNALNKTNVLSRVARDMKEESRAMFQSCLTFHVYHTKWMRLLLVLFASVWTSAICLVGVVLFWRNESIVVLSITLVFGVVAVSVVNAWTWIRLFGKPIELLISNKGIRYGNEEWLWKRVTAIRLVRQRDSCFMFVIWPGPDFGPGRMLRTDSNIARGEAIGIVRELQEHVQSRYVSLKCELRD
ncbi:hypothetical protein ETAA8_28380 [Anatilimnocola aggregata]|uniref:Uncharacterized protein n=1 Tax=Anatilimnocola aggregata TaxID=2528021 RepID=A0A517YBX6_9BACT|nr:hypothetical protein ETAA8_28380 [Anatilimnocola aggregata]